MHTKTIESIWHKHISDKNAKTFKYVPRPGNVLFPPKMHRYVRGVFIRWETASYNNTTTDIVLFIYLKRVLAKYEHDIRYVDMWGVVVVACHVSSDGDTRPFMCYLVQGYKFVRLRTIDLIYWIHQVEQMRP